MEFIVTPSRARIPDEYPFVKLTRVRRKEDGAISSTFRVTFFLTNDEAIDLGFVKIIRKGQTSGPTKLRSRFTSLSLSFCSLGQNYRYYELLRKSLPERRSEFLSALRDVATNPSIRREFEREPAFEMSLLRQSSAKRALEDIGRLIGDSPRSITNSKKVHFETSVGGKKFRILFSFGPEGILPRRLNVVIGGNGTGKTILLANLAYIASAKRDLRRGLSHKYGKFLHEDHDFGSVIAISYSAFDRFDLPGKTRRERKVLEERGEIEGYVYCGIRRITNFLRKTESLRSIDELEKELLANIRRAQRRNESILIRQISQILSQDASFLHMDLERFLTSKQIDPAQLRRFSTGHKLVINIVVQLIAHLVPNSLVVFDEPESYLHPPLLAKLLQSLQVILQRMDSLCVLATHSPVVLQEIPSEQVNVLRRVGTATHVVKPRHETFGEDVGTLTSEVYQLNSDESPFFGVLDQLAKTYSLKQIERLFGRQLGFQARSYLEALPKGANDAGS